MQQNGVFQYFSLRGLFCVKSVWLRWFFGWNYSINIP